MLILNDKNPCITEAWATYFHKEPEVYISTRDFRELPHLFDNLGFILSTAGNSFGIMGGGLDLAIAQHFPGVEEAVQAFIRDMIGGELFVGTGIFVPLMEDQLPFIALWYTPTMRIPQRLRNAENVYLATYATLRSTQGLYGVYQNADRELAVVLPGFGGQCGGLDPNAIAKAMHLAYNNWKNRVLPTNHTQMIEYAKQLNF